jgi:hypothetical protein
MTQSRLAIIALLAAAAGISTTVAFAQEAVQEPVSSQVSTLTREQVIAEYLDAKKKGLIPHGDRSTFPQAAGVPLTREQVQAELAEARRLGLLHYGEASRFATEKEVELVREAGRRATQSAIANR